MEQLIGHWVELRLGQSVTVGGLPSFVAGYVEDVTEWALYVRTFKQETLFLPRQSILSARIVDPEDTSDAGILLRPANAPQDEQLLRPAGDSESDPDKLLRPSDR